MVFYEAPHRLKETLDDMVALLGDRQAVVAREVSKVYEEFLRGSLEELTCAAESRELRGEMTLVISGSAGESRVDEDRLKAEIRDLKDRGLRVKEIAEILGERFGYPKKEIYRLALLAEKLSP